MNENCLDSLVKLPEVEGAFISHRDGRIIGANMPQFLSQEQLHKAARLLNQNRNAASAAVGEIRRCEFRYLEQKFFVYYLPLGQLFVLCRPQANPERIDLEVEVLRTELENLLKTTADSGQPTTPPPSTAARDSVVPPAGPESPQKKRPIMPLLVMLAFVLIALLGAGFFFLLGETHSDKTNLVAANQAQASPPPATPAAIPPTPATTILRLHGSNTIGAKLAPALATEFLKQVMQAKEIVRVPGQPDEQNVEGTLRDGRRVAIEIQAHGSSTSFKDLNQDLCDVGMASRSIKSKEVEQLQRFGNMTGPASENVLALDGIAVIVHPANGVQNMAQQQIADIFSGRIKDWQEIPQSGLSGAIKVIARDEKSGTWDTFKHLVLRGQPLLSSAERLEDSRELTAQVAADTNAIGFIGLPYIKPSKAVAVSEQGTEAVFPTTFTVATEDYPLARRLFLYIPANPTNPQSRPFVEFALSDAGQKIAREIGFVELTIDEMTPEIAANAPPKYRQNAAAGARLSLNFRFRSGSTEIDNRGLRDIDRLVSFLGRQQNRQRAVKLFGFADNIGSRTANCQLSQIRAEKVATVLKAHGINAETVQGFCDDMPVADNDTAAGREKNRRVEVWLTR